MFLAPSSEQVCPVVVEVFSTVKQSEQLQRFAKSQGYRVISARQEFGDVGAFKVEVPDTPAVGDGFGMLTGSGSADRLRELSDRGAYLDEPKPIRDGRCQLSALYRVTARARLNVNPAVFEFDTDGGRSAAQVASRLAVPATAYTGPNGVIVKVSNASGRSSFIYRARRGDFGPVRGIGLLTSPEALQATHQEAPD